MYIQNFYSWCIECIKSSLLEANGLENKFPKESGESICTNLNIHLINISAYTHVDQVCRGDMCCILSMQYACNIHVYKT